MKHSPLIYDELKAVSPFLAEQEKTNVFSVPQDYFSGLTGELSQKIKGESFILPASETHFFKVPEGYFDSLPGNILSKIKSLEQENSSEEPDHISPMLDALKNKNVFTVPVGYFDTLAGKIFNKIQPPKVVVMKRRSTFWNYAAAAVLTGIMAVSALWTKNNSAEHLQVANNNNIPSYVKDASKYKDQQQINAGIANLTDDDIIKYLENTSTDADDATLAASIDAKDLPSEQDYLIDENTLNNYLHKIDVKNNGN